MRENELEDGWNVTDHQAGTSLIELSIGTVLALAVLGAVLTAMLQHAAQRRADAELSLAVSACSNTLEQLRSLPLPALATLDSTGFDVPAANGTPGGLTPLPGDIDGLPGRLSITVDQTLAGETLYRVSAKVVWRGTSRRRSVEFDTLMGRRR